MVSTLNYGFNDHLHPLLAKTYPNLWSGLGKVRLGQRVGLF